MALPADCPATNGLWCCCRQSFTHHLLPRLFPYLPSTSAAKPVIGSAHARDQLSAALSTDVWRQSWKALKADTSEAFQSAAAPPKSSEDALDRLHALCTSSIDTYRSSFKGSEPSMPSTCAMHACYSALMHLSLAVQMPSNAANLQPDQKLAWSELMAVAQRQQLGPSSLTCWPCIKILPSAQQPAAAVGSFSDDKLQAVQALLNQASLLLEDQYFEHINEQVIVLSLLDLGLMQAWEAVQAVAQPTAIQHQQAAAAEAATSASKPEAALQLADLLPSLARLLSCLPELMQYFVSKTLQQELGQLDLDRGIDHVMSVGLERQQVGTCHLVHVWCSRCLHETSSLHKQLT